MKRKNDAETDAVGQPLSAKGKKVRMAVTAAVVLAVVIINVLVSFASDARLWYIDMTSDRYMERESALYTLSESCRKLIGEQSIPMVEEVNRDREARGEEAIKVNIIFCTDKDYIENDSMMRYVNLTARALEKEYPDAIDVQYVNIEKNPSAVQRFKTTSASTIYNSDVIVEFGSEYRVKKISSFYYTDAGKTSPWAYNGEQELSAMILSLTRAEFPICAVTTNHGEILFNENGDVKPEYSSFIRLIGGAGYKVVFLDLENDEIPENCRMMITFGPRSDFKAYGSLGESGVSEIDKLDRYLEESNAFFYVCDRDTPVLSSLEEYLKEWGIEVSRAETDEDTLENFAIRDGVNCTDTGKGDVIIGQYREEGISGGITADMRDQTYPPMVVFGNATAIKPSDSYNKMYVPADDDSGTPAFSYHSYYRNGVYRSMFSVFSSYDTASAYVGGELHEVATEYEFFELMTWTREARLKQETDYTSIDRASYVFALSSTDFAKNDVLDSSAYGNADILLSALRSAGAEPVGANIKLKAFYVYDMDAPMTEAQYTAQMNTWFICLSAIPAAVALISGVFVVIKRRVK